MLAVASLGDQITEMSNVPEVIPAVLLRESSLLLVHGGLRQFFSLLGNVGHKTTRGEEDSC